MFVYRSIQFISVHHSIACCNAVIGKFDTIETSFSASRGDGHWTATVFPNLLDHQNRLSHTFTKMIYYTVCFFFILDDLMLFKIACLSVIISGLNYIKCLTFHTLGQLMNSTIYGSLCQRNGT